MMASRMPRWAPDQAEPLVLRPVTPDMKKSMERSRADFGAVAGVPLPDGWPEFPQAFRPKGTEHPAPWTGYLFLSPDAKILIGNGGFVAPPDASGTVEIGYEIAPRHRNRGYATTAASMLLKIARESGAKAVIAHSLAEPNASNAVMGNIGMTFREELQNGPFPVWRWQIDLAATNARGLPPQEGRQGLADSRDTTA